jgi:transposase
MKMRDHLGIFYEDKQFAELFSHTGQPALAAWRLALVTILQFIENLTDRQAADAVRRCIDWKYLLGLELQDSGFHHSVLSEFRGRLVAGGKETLLLDGMLAHFREAGMLKSRGRQRSDSTHVLGAIRALTRLACVGETLRHALNTLAATAPEWLLEHSDPEWIDHYSKRVDEYRLPKSKAKREAYANKVGGDGLTLLSAIYEPAAPPWLRELAAVQVLRQVWLQNYTWTEDGTLRWRQSKERPPTARRINSPYDVEVRYGKKRSTVWVGYKVHLTESHDEDAPHLITHVETTPATESDCRVTGEIHQALEGKELLPERHSVDSGYIDAELLADSQQTYGVDLFGPTRGDFTWQSQQDEGFATKDFTFDWDKQQALCPRGHTSVSWREGMDNRGNPVVRIKFSTNQCGPCPVNEKCTRSDPPRRPLVIRPEAHFKALQAARQREKTDAFAEEYAQRAGVEGTISQTVRTFGLRRTRYIGMAKTHLQHLLIAAAVNVVRVIRWLEQEPLAQTRQSHFARLHASAHG